jgi:hypothetical protein
MQILSGVDEKLDGLNQNLAKDVMAALIKHYPAYEQGWTVIVNQRGGVINILNALISNRMGYTVLTVDLISDPSMRSVIMGAGEYLERYRLSREKVINVENSLSDVKRDWKHEMVADR